MFNLSGEKVLFVFVVALVVLGPDHLPMAMRRAGQILGQLRDISEALKLEVNQAMDDPGEPIVKPMSRPPVSAVPDVEPAAPQPAAEGTTSPTAPETENRDDL